jgi:TrmH family RNA methyltransferase
MTRKESWRRAVAEVESARTSQGRRRSGRCSLEGTRLFERALAAGVQIEQALVLESFLVASDPRLRGLRQALEASGCALHVVPEDVMESLTEGRSIGSVLGLARMPEAQTLSDVLASCESRPALLLASIDSNDPGNVGALVRTAHVSGVAALLTVRCSDPFHPRAVRTSMGSVFRLPVIAYPDFDALLLDLRAADVRTVGTVATGGVSLPTVEGAEQATAVVVGSEAFGLSPEACEALDVLVTIPMAEGVDSYSLNAAAAVLLYEFRHPRRISRRE